MSTQIITQLRQLKLGGKKWTPEFGQPLKCLLPSLITLLPAA